MFSYGAKLPAAVRQILVDYNDHMDKGRSKRETAKLVVQALIGVWLIIGKNTHLEKRSRKHCHLPHYFAYSLV